MAKPKDDRRETVIAASPIKHDGDDYAPGEPIEVTPDQAERLVVSGSATRPAAKTEAETKPEPVKGAKK